MEVHGQSTEPRIQIPLKHEFVLQWNEPSLAYFPDLDSCLSGYTLCRDKIFYEIERAHFLHFGSPTPFSAEDKDAVGGTIPS